MILLNKRFGNKEIKIYYYPENIPEYQIEISMEENVGDVTTGSKLIGTIKEFFEFDFHNEVNDLKPEVITKISRIKANGGKYGT